MQLQNRLENIENLFRQHGIESEDIFYVIESRYINYYNLKLTPNLKEILNKRSTIINNLLQDSKLIKTLDDLIKSDSSGENLPIMYQYFLSKRFRDSSGKFFTPKEIAEAMIELLPHQSNVTIMDPTCGGGTFLLEAYKKWGKKCKLIGNDVDRTLIHLTDLILSLNGLDQHQKKLIISNIFKPTKEIKEFYGKIDYIVANPPFSLPINDFEESSKLFSLGYKNSDVLFIDLAYKLLKPSGRLICLLPHSIVSNQDYEDLRKSVEDDWDILGTIILPEGVFHLTSDTTTRADIVMLSKKPNNETSHIVFSNVPSIGIPIKNRNYSTENYLKKIVSDPRLKKALNIKEVYRNEK